MWLHNVKGFLKICQNTLRIAAKNDIIVADAFVKEAKTMATKSFLKNVSLRTEKQCQAFVKALERSENQPKKANETSRPVHEMTRDQIRKVFGSDNA